MEEQKKSFLSKHFKNMLIAAMGVTIVVLLLKCWDTRCAPCAEHEQIKPAAQFIEPKIQEEASTSEIVENETTPEAVIEEALVEATEQELWDLAEKNKTKYSYERYLSAYPNGAYKNKAQEGIDQYKDATASKSAAVEPKSSEKNKVSGVGKKKIDDEVAAWFKTTKNQLPSMSASTPKDGKVGEISNLTIGNDTDHKLNLLYSGPDSKKIHFEAREKKSFSLLNGTYKIVALVDEENVQAFIKTETLTGLNYSSIFYIED
jgi:hypothetical protein